LAQVVAIQLTVITLFLAPLLLLAVVQVVRQLMHEPLLEMLGVQVVAVELVSTAAT
jgi:hypothetical protein